MKNLSFSTNRNPGLNTIQKGNTMRERFRNSPRWELISNEVGGYGKNDHDFSHGGVNCWKDKFKGTLVKESFSTNRRGIVNSIRFEEITEWPEPKKVFSSDANFNSDDEIIF